MVKKKKTISVMIPEGVHDIKLETVIKIHEKKTIIGQAKAFMELYGGAKPGDFNNDALIALWMTVVKMLHDTPAKKYRKRIGQYRLPVDLTMIRVGAYIELCNLDLEEFNDLPYALGVFYRKDHDKPYSLNELIETGSELEKKSLEVGMFGAQLSSELIEILMDRFPILFPPRRSKENKKPVKKVNERKAYDMLMSLTDEKFIDWDVAKQKTLADAFVFLEEKRKKQIKMEMDRAQKAAQAKAKGRR